MQFGRNTCHKFRELAESVLVRPEMGQNASNLRLLDAKNRLSSISIRQVGTRYLANIAGRVHSKSEKLFVPATLPLMTASVAIPHPDLPEQNKCQWVVPLRLADRAE